MLQQLIKTTLLTGLFFGLAAGCSKSKHYAKRLDGDKWKVSAWSVDGGSLDNPPELLFKDCDVYEESCEGSWISLDGRAQFVWQFREKGQVLEIANQTDHAHSLADVKAAEQCIAFTGVYSVKKSKRRWIQLQSSSTYGYPGKKVNIELERLD